MPDQMAKTGVKFRFRSLLTINNAWKLIYQFPYPIQKFAGFFLPYCGSEPPVSYFEQGYKTRVNDRFKAMSQLSRYSIIKGYVQYHSHSSILDLGCGQGILYAHLRNSGILETITYTGVDVSEVAISEAKTTNGASQECFLCEDLQAFISEPVHSFGTIILNEVLYYFSNPFDTLTRCSTLLDDDGVIIISMYDSYRNERCWQQVDQVLHCLDSVKVEHHPTGKSWRIAVYSK